MICILIIVSILLTVRLVQKKFRINFRSDEKHVLSNLQEILYESLMNTSEICFEINACCVSNHIVRDVIR